MNFRTTAAMLAVLIVLAGAVYYITRTPAPDPTASATPTQPVVTFTATDATKLVLSGGSNTTELTRDATGWTISQPIQGPAETGQVEGWVQQMGSLTSERVISDVTDLTTYGLATPKLNVQVDLKTGPSVKLEFGDKTPDGASYYVRVSSDATKAKSVYLVGSTLGDDLTAALTKPPKALPTPTPLPTLVPTTITPPPPVVAGSPTATPGG